jgi:hypothetical protein
MIRICTAIFTASMLFMPILGNAEVTSPMLNQALMSKIQQISNQIQVCRAVNSFGRDAGVVSYADDGTGYVVLVMQLMQTEGDPNDPEFGRLDLNKNGLLDDDRLFWSAFSICNQDPYRNPFEIRLKRLDQN